MEKNLVKAKSKDLHGVFIRAWLGFDVSSLRIWKGQFGKA